MASESIVSMITQLMPHQTVAVEKMCKSFMSDDYTEGTLLADDVGLGKTITCLATMVNYLKFQSENHEKDDSIPIRPCLVVVPPTLVDMWLDAIKKHTKGLKPFALKDGKTTRNVSHPSVSELNRKAAWSGLKNARIIIISYDTLSNEYHKHLHEQLLFKMKFGICCLDEGHKIRNYGTQRESAVQFVSGISDRHILMTATAVNNRVVDLHTQLTFLHAQCLPQISSSHMSGGKMDAAKQFEVLSNYKAILSRLMIRRTLKNIQSLESADSGGGDGSSSEPNIHKGLIGTIPSAPMTHWRMIVEFSMPEEREVYMTLMSKLKDDFAEHESLLSELSSHSNGFGGSSFKKSSSLSASDRSELKEKIDAKKNHILSLFTNLYMMCCFPPLVNKNIFPPSSYHELTKMKALIKIVQEKVKPDEKFVVFGTHIEQVTAARDILMDKLNIPALLITGDVPIERRKSIINSFLKPGGSYRALVMSSVGTLGLNIVEAVRTIHLSIFQNPQEKVQADGRVNRIGQTKPCTSSSIIIKDTLEENIMVRNHFKLFLSDVMLNVDNDRHPIDILRAIQGVSRSLLKGDNPELASITALGDDNNSSSPDYSIPSNYLMYNSFDEAMASMGSFKSVAGIQRLINLLDKSKPSASSGSSSSSSSNGSFVSTLNRSRGSSELEKVTNLDLEQQLTPHHRGELIVITDDEKDLPDVIISMEEKRRKSEEDRKLAIKKLQDDKERIHSVELSLTRGNEHRFLMAKEATESLNIWISEQCLRLGINRTTNAVKLRGHMNQTTFYAALKAGLIDTIWKYLDKRYWSNDAGVVFDDETDDSPPLSFLSPLFSNRVECTRKIPLMTPLLVTQHRKSNDCFHAAYDWNEALLNHFRACLDTVAFVEATGHKINNSSVIEDCHEFLTKGKLSDDELSTLSEMGCQEGKFFGFGNYDYGTDDEDSDDSSDNEYETIDMSKKKNRLRALLKSVDSMKESELGDCLKENVSAWKKISECLYYRPVGTHLGISLSREFAVIPPESHMSTESISKPQPVPVYGKTYNTCPTHTYYGYGSKLKQGCTVQIGNRHGTISDVIMIVHPADTLAIDFKSKNLEEFVELANNNKFRSFYLISGDGIMNIALSGIAFYITPLSAFRGKTIFDCLIDLVTQKPQQNMDDLAIILLDYEHKLEWFISKRKKDQYQSVVPTDVLKRISNQDDLSIWETRNLVDSFTDMVYYSVMINKLMKNDPFYHDGSTIIRWKKVGHIDDDPIMVASIHSFVYDKGLYTNRSSSHYCFRVKGSTKEEEPHVIFIPRLWCLKNQLLATYDREYTSHELEQESDVQIWTQYIIDTLVDILYSEFQALLGTFTTEEHCKSKVTFVFADTSFINLTFKTNPTNGSLTNLFVGAFRAKMDNKQHLCGSDRSMVFQGGYTCTNSSIRQDIKHVWPNPGAKQYAKYRQLRELEVLAKYRHYELTGDVVSRVDDFTDCPNSSNIGYRYELEQHGIPYHYFEGNLEEMLYDNDLESPESIDSLSDTDAIDDILKNDLGHDDTDDDAGFGTDKEDEEEEEDDDLDDRTEDQKQFDLKRTVTLIIDDDDDEGDDNGNSVKKGKEIVVRLPMKRTAADVIDLSNDEIVSKKQKLVE